jgi:streptogramin lyase
MLLREYSLPAIPAITALFVRTPHGITYDANSYIWSTDYSLDKIYRLTPATAIDDTSTTAWDWSLPNTMGKRSPSHLIVDDARGVVWFCCPISKQFSQLNWTTNAVADWAVGQFPFAVTPWDLVMDEKGDIWFTSFNSTRYVSFNPAAGFTMYTLPIAGAPSGLVEIATNGSHLFMTDFGLDRLYVVAIAAPWFVSVFPLNPGGKSLGVADDAAGNIWVTQPGSDLVNEQLNHSMPKSQLTANAEPIVFPPLITEAGKQLINITIRLTTVRAAKYTRAPEVIEDPVYLWSVPTAPSVPWGIDADHEGYAWFTEPVGPHIGVVRPATNEIWEYLVPTPNSLPLYLTAVPSPIIAPDRIWFTEYRAAKWGELFTLPQIDDVCVCPSLPSQYPPPSPGSIRWTSEPGAEIWVDAPSNGFDPTDHDNPERNVTNHVYARVKNAGTGTATNVLVKFYYHNMSLGFASFIPLPPTAPLSAHWVFIGSYNIASLAAAASIDVYVNWTIDESVPEHQCIGVQVTYATDMNLYNNVAYRNFIVVWPLAASDIPLEVLVWITNTEDRTRRVSIGLEGVPDGWEVGIEPNDFDLPAGESRQLKLSIDPSSAWQAGLQVIIHATGMIDKEVVGHVWIQVNVLRASEITCSVQPTTIPAGDVVYFGGAISPARSGVQVYVRIRQPDNVTYELGALTDAYGAFSMATGLNSKLGTYTVIAYWNGDGYLLGAQSDPCSYNVVLRPIISLNLELFVGIGVGFGIMGLIALVLLRRRPARVTPRK